MEYYKCKAVFLEETEHGVKRKPYNYLVQALSVTEAEANLTQYISKNMPDTDFTVEDVVKQKIEAVIEVNRGALN